MELGFGEADVRRLGGEAAFTWADLFQRGGHVLGPTTSARLVRGVPASAVLAADVRGVWRRVDRATATVNGGRIVPSCGCGATRLCRHVGALLLHWLRAPETFAVATPASTGAAPPAETSPADPSPGGELASLLERETMARLRALARERGLPARASGKAELVAQLAPALADRDGIDAALARLPSEERRVLDAAGLVADYSTPTDEALAAAYAALGGAGPPPVDRPLSLGLLLRQPVRGYGPPCYHLPWAVAGRLAPRDDLLPPIAEPVAPRSASVGLDELIQVIVHDLASHAVRWRPAGPLEQYAGYLPSGWRLDPAEHGGARLIDLYARRPLPTVRLLPPRLPLADADLARLAERSGAPPVAVAFVVRLLASLGALEGVDRLRPREDALARLFGLDLASRLGAFCAAWLALTDWTELSLLVDADGPLQLHCQLSYGASELPEPEMVDGRRTVAGLIGRAAPGSWHGVEALLEPLSRLSPRPLVRPAYHRPNAAWFADRGGTRLRRQTVEGWQRVARAAVGVLLDGPLSWLGLVDVSGEPGRVDAFRVRPAAAVLTGREVRLEAAPGELLVDDDLTVLVQPGAADVDTHARLGRLGELLEASPAGLRYRLTAERVQAAFDAGLTGPDLLDFLAAGSRVPLPAGARSIVEQWWIRYGAARLYDELCLIELADDFLLPELLSTTPLRGWLIHSFSPRLIAVEPSAVDDLVAALARLGHAPRVVEAS
jgi:hypothetical protein